MSDAIQASSPRPLIFFSVRYDTSGDMRLSVKRVDDIKVLPSTVTLANTFILTSWGLQVCTRYLTGHFFNSFYPGRSPSCRKAVYSFIMNAPRKTTD